MPKVGRWNGAVDSFYLLSCADAALGTHGREEGRYSLLVSLPDCYKRCAHCKIIIFTPRTKKNRRTFPSLTRTDSKICINRQQSSSRFLAHQTCFTLKQVFLQRIALSRQDLPKGKAATGRSHSPKDFWYFKLLNKWRKLGRSSSQHICE